MNFSYLMYEPIFDQDELAARMARVAGLGYRGIELTATPALCEAADHVVELTELTRLPVVSLLSGWSYSNEGLCLSSPDATVRERAVARLGDYSRLAARLGAIVVVGLMQGLRTDEPDEARAGDRIAACLAEAARLAGSEGVTLVIEPVNHLQVGFHNAVAEARALVDRVGSPALGFMLDTFHMNIEEPSVVAGLRQHGPAARHVHLCETHGGPFGSGGLDFPGVLAALREAGYAGWVSTKVYRRARWDEAARASADFLRRCGVSWPGAIPTP